MYVALATQAATELRRAYPKLYPPVSHVWQRLEAAQLHSPLLCAACFTPVHPEDTAVVRTIQNAVSMACLPSRQCSAAQYLSYCAGWQQWLQAG